MTPLGSLVQHGEEALLVAALVSLPILAVAALVGLVVAAFQAASQVQDPTISHLPRFLAVAAVLIIAGPWVGHQIAAFAERMFLLAATH